MFIKIALKANGIFFDPYYNPIKKENVSKQLFESAKKAYALIIVKCLYKKITYVLFCIKY